MDDIEVQSVTLRNRLKAVLKAAGLSQEEVARRAGIPYRHFNRFILGRAEPTLVQAEAVALVLGVPVSELFTVKFRTRAARKVAA
jgi:transcriptional regulator with XRE-family HTH domain